MKRLLLLSAFILIPTFAHADVTPEFKDRVDYIVENSSYWLDNVSQRLYDAIRLHGESGEDGLYAIQFMDSMVVRTWGRLETWRIEKWRIRNASFETKLDHLLWIWPTKRPERDSLIVRLAEKEATSPEQVLSLIPLCGNYYERENLRRMAYDMGKP